MFEAVGAAFAAWREVLHVSEWTGLSVGTLAGLAAVIYLVPALRSLAIAAAVAVAAGYFGLILGNHTGRTDMKAEWDAANARAAAAAKAADAEAQKSLDAQYQPVIAALQARNGDLQAQVADYESKMVGALGSCQLGADALRLRKPK